MLFSQLETFCTFITALTNAKVLDNSGIKFVRAIESLRGINTVIRSLLKNSKSDMLFDYGQLEPVREEFKNAKKHISALPNDSKQFEVFEDKFLWLYDLMHAKFIIPEFTESIGDSEDDSDYEPSESDESDDDDEKDDDDEDDEEDDDDVVEVDIEIEDGYEFDYIGTFIPYMKEELDMFAEKLDALKLKREPVRPTKKRKCEDCDDEDDYDFF